MSLAVTTNHNLTLGDSSVLHCASLLRTIFASLARANECVHLHNERNFPQGKLDSEINVPPFLLNEHNDQYFLSDNNTIVYILSSLIKKNKKFLLDRKEDMAESG